MANEPLEYTDDSSKIDDSSIIDDSYIKNIAMKNFSDSPSKESHNPQPKIKDVTDEIEGAEPLEQSASGNNQEEGSQLVRKKKNPQSKPSVQEMKKRMEEPQPHQQDILKLEENEPLESVKKERKDERPRASLSPEERYYEDVILKCLPKLQDAFNQAVEDYKTQFTYYFNPFQRYSLWSSGVSRQDAVCSNINSFVAINADPNKGNPRPVYALDEMINILQSVDFSNESMIRHGSIAHHTVNAILKNDELSKALDLYSIAPGKALKVYTDFRISEEHGAPSAKRYFNQTQTSRIENYCKFYVSHLTELSKLWRERAYNYSKEATSSHLK